LQNAESYQSGSSVPVIEARQRLDYLRTSLIWVYLVFFGLLIGVSAAIKPAVAILVVLGLPALPWAIRNIHVVVLLLAVYTPFEEFILKWMPGSLAAALRFAPEALILLLLAAIVLRNIGHGTWWTKTPIDLPAALFLGFSALSALANNVPPIVGVLGIREFARYILLYYLVVNAGLTYKTMKVMTGALLAVAALEAGIGLMQVVLGNRFSLLLTPEDVVVGGVLVREGFTQILSGGTRIFGTLGRYSRFGFFLAIFCVLALALYATLRSKLGRELRLCFLAFAALAAPALILSYSRTSLFVLCTGIIVVLLITRWKMALYVALIIPVVAMLLLLSWVTVEDWTVAATEEASILERFASTFSPDYLDVLLRRGRLFIIARVSPIMLREYPLLGLGPGTVGSTATGGGTNSPGLYPEHSHIDWLDVTDVGRLDSLRFLHDVGWASILAQVGVLGLAAFLWAMLELARAALCCFAGSKDLFVRGLSAGYVGLLAAVIVGNLAVFSLSFRAVSLYVWLLGGLVATIYIRICADQTPEEASMGEVPS